MTKTRWAELTGKQQWDVQVALRGPDCQQSENIKWITTSVLRWAMHTVMRVGGTINEDLRVTIIPADPHEVDRVVRSSKLLKVLCWSPAHFFQHVREASGVLGIGCWSLPNEDYFEAASLSHQHFSLVRLWESAKQHNLLPLQDELERHLIHHFHTSPAEVLKVHTAYIHPNKEEGKHAIG